MEREGERKRSKVGEASNKNANESHYYIYDVRPDTEREKRKKLELLASIRKISNSPDIVSISLK